MIIIFVNKRQCPEDIISFFNYHDGLQPELYLSSRLIVRIRNYLRNNKKFFLMKYRVIFSALLQDRSGLGKLNYTYLFKIKNVLIVQ